MKQCERKFTLIELLICISIIAVLASLLLPALHSARGKAQTVFCLNNIKTLTHGLQLYEQTYGSFPPTDSGAYSSGGRIWYQKIYVLLTEKSEVDVAYFAGNRIYRTAPFLRCPAYRLNETAIIDYKTIAYGLNEAVSRTPVEKIKRPSWFILTGDSDEDGYYANIISYEYYLLGNRHNQRACTGFIDGHGNILEARKYIQPGAAYGSMNYQTGATLTRSTQSGSCPAIIKQYWRN